MATFAIESNGRIEKTVVYFNGQQLGGIKEIFLNLDEEGTFDGILQYEGTDKQIRTKQIFSEYLENLKIVEPSFTEEEATELQQLKIDSEGDIEDTIVTINDEELEGIVSLFVHIKSAENKNGISSLFSKNKIPDHVEFKAEITFRNEDDTTETEEIF
ncbi:MAG: hypothetical protein EPN82_07545 [Bacteroidetes bacterium]|nr:MAG: hypothetical protein EPN82_07545 [Bacteroidota bacterium]